MLLTFCKDRVWIVEAKEVVRKGVLGHGERENEGKWAEVVEPRILDMETTSVYRHFARGADADRLLCTQVLLSYHRSSYL